MKSFPFSSEISEIDEDNKPHRLGTDAERQTIRRSNNALLASLIMLCVITPMMVFVVRMATLLHPMLPMAALVGVIAIIAGWGTITLMIRSYARVHAIYKKYE